MKVGVLTLGCDKNTVDSERYLAQLTARGLRHTAVLADADVILVNTCGFIDAAKRESIDAIVEAGRYRDEGVCRTVVAVGCMVERLRPELEEALPEVDIFLGASEMELLIPKLEDRGLLLPSQSEVHPGERQYAGDLPHVRYLKISEGCDHGCAFCAIPLMRGRHRSFSMGDIVREAQLLELQGAREINLVAQDLAHYGRDRRDGSELPDLLRALLDETSVPWFRLLYLYSAGMTSRLLALVAAEPRIVPYIDMPMQHGSDAVLARMRRPERGATIRDTVARVRAAVAEVAIRTTCIVGYPGETDADFATLLDVLEEVRFDRVGAFTYSPQEGTRSALLEDDVPETVKRDRLERLTELQRLITADRYEARIGRVVRSIVDRCPVLEHGDASTEHVGSRANDDGGDRTGAADLTQARTIWQADDIDGVTRFASPLPPGTLVDVAIEDVEDDYDFRASLVSVIDRPAARAVRPPVNRSLPVAHSSMGSFGR